MDTTVIQLTDKQKIDILEKTKELLGPNGENWTKACWWGIKRDDAGIREWLSLNGYEPDIGTEDIAEIAAETDFAPYRRDTQDPDEANVWCLMGAIEESAYRLGIIERRIASQRFAEPISLQNLVRSRAEWEYWDVVDVNDNPKTQWEDVKGLIDERLAQLRG